MPEGTAQRMRERLSRLAPLELAIEDESALHVGHVGAASGGGHYRMILVSAAFAGQPRVARHRLVYDALTDLMQREIHALASGIDQEPLLNKQGLRHLWRLFRLSDEAPATFPRLSERTRLYSVCRLKFLLFSCRVCCGEAQPLAGVVD